jgi:hypothetical protein
MHLVVYKDFTALGVKGRGSYQELLHFMDSMYLSSESDYPATCRHQTISLLPFQLVSMHN